MTNEDEKDVSANAEIEGADDEEFDLSADQQEERKVITQPSEPTVKSLRDRATRGRLNIQPDFQRQFVWDAKKSSRLIESALLDIPLPVVYLAESKDGKTSVIDGQQRLTSFFLFIDNELELTGMQVYKNLNRKKFVALSEELQDKILEHPIRVTTFKKGSDEDLQFEIFERLNSGSVPLNAQELRNCVYRGRYNTLLRELSGDATYMKLMGQGNSHKRMLDVEFVLRFAAFYFQGYLNYKSPMKKFLNEEMDKRQNISDADANDLRAAFKQAVTLIDSMLGKHAFKRFYPGENKENPNGYWEKAKFNASLYDVLMWSLARADKNLVMNNLDAIREGLLDLMSDDGFIHSILYATSGKRQVEARFDKWRGVLDSILENQRKEPRCFSRELKEELYKQNPTCQICGNRIAHVDDAAVDHIEQYWRGGKTIPENARLVHRYCNSARPRND